MDKFEASLEAFDDSVIEASKQTPVLLDLWARWCSPCLVIAPLLDAVIERLQGRVRLAKLEVDRGENMKLAGRYRVRGFPTVILFYQGDELARFSGVRSQSQILAFLAEHLGHPDAA